MMLHLMSNIQLGSIGTFYPLGYFGLEGIEHFWAYKIRQEKLTQFIKSSELYQVFMKNFCTKISTYSRSKYLHISILYTTDAY